MSGHRLLLRWHAGQRLQPRADRAYAAQGQWRHHQDRRLYEHRRGGKLSDIYWKANWLGSSQARPHWLSPANDEGWGNNYRVRYWNQDWPKLILGSPDAYLDRLIATGFDGVYLDIVDGFEFWQDPSRAPDDARRTAADEMIQLVTRIARYAWSRNPNFYIIPQNGEALLESEVYGPTSAPSGWKTSSSLGPMTIEAGPTMSSRTLRPILTTGWAISRTPSATRSLCWRSSTSWISLTIVAGYQRSMRRCAAET